MSRRVALSRARQSANGFFALPRLRYCRFFLRGGSAGVQGKAAYEGYQGHGVLTYAILEALHRPEGAGADTVDVFGLAAHVSREVPVISQRAFGLRQQPRFTPTGDNFPLGVRTAVLPSASATLPVAIPAAPTHVNTDLLRVFKEAGGKGGVVLRLPPFTTVTLLKSERGWAQIAQDGRALGYVPEAKLNRLATSRALEPISTAPGPKGIFLDSHQKPQPKRTKKSAPAKDGAEGSFWKK
jgi:hypothetical protein